MKVICAPQKVGTGLEGNLRTLRSLRPRIIGMTEMDVGRVTWISTALRVLGKAYRAFAKDKGAHSQEIPLFLRLAVFCRVLEFDTFHLSADIPGPGLGNDRWVNRVIMRWFMFRWVIYNTHLNAGVQNTSGPPFEIRHNNRVPAYKQEIERLEEFLNDDLHKYRGRVVLMGDLNMMPDGEGLTWQWSPHQMFKRLNMKYVNSRVVYLARGHGLVLRSHRVIPAKSKQNAADHAWVVGSLRRKVLR